MCGFGNSFDHVARFEHQCIWCGGPIPKGEKYSLWKGVFDGEWQRNKFHKECAGESDVNTCDGFIPGEGEMPERVRKIVEMRV